MSYEEKIYQSFVYGYVGKAMPIDELPENAPAWTFIHEDRIGAAILLPPDKNFDYYGNSENITIQTDKTWTIGSYTNFLVLYCQKNSLSRQFAKICSDFVNPELRQEILDNPDKWWQGWRGMMGDKLQDKKIYDVLAELLVCEYLQKQKIEFVWAGPKRATVDIETPEKSYEVKSSTSKDKWIFTASSERQLDFEKREKPLSLAFCQLEESTLDGRSVNDIVESLVTLGRKRDEIEELLKIKFPAGEPLRDKKYICWNLREFPVDKDFPRITHELLSSGIFPPGIVAVTSYQVDLSAVKGFDLMKKESN